MLYEKVFKRNFCPTELPHSKHKKFEIQQKQPKTICEIFAKPTLKSVTYLIHLIKDGLLQTERLH